jgi:agmatinase
MNRFNVIGFDIVEVSPLIDHNGITSLLGAKIAREGILLWS